MYFIHPMDFIISTTTDATATDAATQQFTELYYLEKIYQLLFIAFVICLAFFASKMLRRTFKNLNGGVNRND